MCILIIRNTVWGVTVLKFTLAFLTSHFSVGTKSQNKYPNVWKLKELLRWNKKRFLSFLKDFQLPEIVSDLIVGL